MALEPSESAMVDSPIASETYVDFRNIEDSNQDIMVAKAQSFFSAFDKPKMLSEVLTQTDLNKFVTLYHNDPRFINEVATYLYNRRNNKNIGVSDYLRLEQRICATKQKNRI